MKINVCSTPQKSEQAEDSTTISFISLYRFASRSDLILISIGLFCTLIKSCTFPFLTLIYGEFTTLLVDRNYGSGTSTPTLVLKWFGGGKILTNASQAENNEEMRNDSIAFVIASLVETAVVIVAGIICVDCFNHAAISQVTRIRIAYFTALMQKDARFYDIEKGKSNFTVRLA
ncbi:multidrug resistance protein homolog 65-like, partial [Contarinia nasturtii]|uniref:multidrug resistance protein homolog 65-like n=1 Tax=Contarinia nasturtii TaxID=265458 RepID=UPI0012D40FE1